MTHRPARSLILLLLALLLVPLVGGCNVMGVAARALPPPTVQAQYKDLAGHSTAVMVWVDRGMRIDWPTIQLNVATSLQSKLAATAAARKNKDLPGTTFPIKPESIVRYQRDYPEIEGMDITQVAPRLKVERLIYVEIEDFSTRAHGAIALYRGQAEATLKVVEIAPDGTATVAYDEPGIRVVFPEGVPPSGIPDADDYKIYRGTVDALTTELGKRFVSYQQDEW